MMLIDTGPLVGLIDDDDQHHALCAATLVTLPSEPLLTTWPCFTEAMYLLEQAGGYRYQARLWDMYFEGKVILHQPTPAETARMATLMERYSDMPMDLADASLVATAESLALRQVFTVDRQFYVYRLEDGGALEVVP